MAVDRMTGEYMWTMGLEAMDRVATQTQISMPPSVIRWWSSEPCLDVSIPAEYAKQLINLLGERGAYYSSSTPLHRQCCDQIVIVCRKRGRDFSFLGQMTAAAPQPVLLWQ